VKKAQIILYVTALALIQLSCSSTLQKRYDQRHGTTSYDTDSDRYRSSNSTSSDDTYRRDYSKATDTNVRASDGNLLAQYEEMDKVGDLVLYELDILERRYDVLINEYKTAKSSSREVISNELDRIQDDEKVLYKAYTNIYRNGKNNWPVVKSQVENTLRSVRRVDK
jgi:hypothetical protein